MEVLSVFIRYILFLTFSTISLFSSVSSNPFLRPGSKQKPPQNKPVIIPKSVSRPNVVKELDFKGYFILNGQPFFSLFNKKVNHSEWVSLSEKTYEEFYTESEDYNIDEYESLGFIKSSEKIILFEEVMNDFNSLFLSHNCTKLEIVKTLKKYVPDFIHIETGKHLDQKM